MELVCKKPNAFGQAFQAARDSEVFQVISEESVRKTFNSSKASSSTYEILKPSKLLPERK